MKKLIKCQIMQNDPIPEDLTIIQIIGEEVVGRENYQDIVVLNVWAIEESK